MELCLGIGEESAETLGLRTRGQTNTGDVVVNMCYRLPDREEEIDEALFRHPEAS